MTKKLYIILEGGLVQNVLVDSQIDLYVEVLNFDLDAEDAKQRIAAYNRMVNDEYMTDLRISFPTELD